MMNMKRERALQPSLASEASGPMQEEEEMLSEMDGEKWVRELSSMLERTSR